MPNAKTTKGRKHFTAAEARKIKEQLTLIRKSESAEQKMLRKELREELDFYITDFTFSRAGFTPENFQELVNKKEIVIQ